MELQGNLPHSERPLEPRDLVRASAASRSSMTTNSSRPRLPDLYGFGSDSGDLRDGVKLGTPPGVGNKPPYMLYILTCTASSQPPADASRIPYSKDELASVCINPVRNVCIMTNWSPLHIVPTTTLRGASISVASASVRRRRAPRTVTPHKF